MNKSTKLVVIIGLIWFLSLVMILLPLTTSERISVGRSSQVYSTPDQNSLLVLSNEKASLYNLNLEKKAEFVNPSYNSPIGFTFYPPVWSPDQKYVILQSEDYVFYLDSENLSLKYELLRRVDLNLTYSDNFFSKSYIDNEYNLHYLRNNSLYKLNPESGNIQKTLDISYNNITIEFAKFHPNGNYVALSKREWNQSTVRYETKLLVINLKSGEYIPIENYDGGGLIFSPSKPYIGYTSRCNCGDEANPISYNFTVYDLENKIYGNSFGIGIRYDEPLAWSYESDKILRVSPNSEKGEFGVANSDSIIIYDSMSGKKEFNFKFSRGYVYENYPLSYTWLSKPNKVAILDRISKGPSLLVIQDIDDQSLLIYNISGFAIAAFGFISAMLIAAVYHQRNPMLFQHITNEFSKKRDKIKISKDNLDDFAISGLNLLIIYYAIISLINSFIGKGGDMSNMPITTIEFLFFSFTSFIDILIIGTIGLLFYENPKSELRHTSTQIKIPTTLLILSILTTRYIQGYSFGIINENVSLVTNLALIFLFVVFALWVLQILKETDTNTLMLVFPLIFLLIYIFSYRETI